MAIIKSIEEKAKRYDEALKKAKDMLSYKEVRREDMEYLFPELKESEEDELSCFESALFTAFSDAWQSYLLGGKVNVKQWAKEHSKELLEAAKEELKEQKSAWSEEDEDILNTIINHFKVDIGCTDEDDMVRWLKFLKDRVQPKQEWSEEEIETCAREAEDNNCIILAKHIRQLKSLRPQNTWKPSEEQMKALNTCLVEGQINHVGQGENLQSLYNELKILKQDEDKSRYRGYKGKHSR